LAQKRRNLNMAHSIFRSGEQRTEPLGQFRSMDPQSRFVLRQARQPDGSFKSSPKHATLGWP